MSRIHRVVPHMGLKAIELDFLQVTSMRETAEAAARSKRDADERQERIVTALESGNLASTNQFRWTLVVAVLAALIALAGLIVAVVVLH